MKELTKENIAVKITDKNREKVRGILDMFGEKLYSDKTMVYNYVYLRYDNKFCGGTIGSLSKTLVKPKQLKQILAKEHLKEGDVCIMKVDDNDAEYLVVFKSFENGNFKCDFTFKRATDNKYIIPLFKDGSFDKFIRFATEEEKSLLEPKKPLLKSENSLKLIEEQNNQKTIIINENSSFPIIVYNTPVCGDEYIHLDLQKEGLYNRNIHLTIEELEETVKAYYKLHPKNEKDNL